MGSHRNLLPFEKVAETKDCVPIHLKSCLYSDYSNQPAQLYKMTRAHCYYFLIQDS